MRTNWHCTDCRQCSPVTGFPLYVYWYELAKCNSYLFISLTTIILCNYTLQLIQSCLYYNATGRYLIKNHFSWKAWLSHTVTRWRLTILHHVTSQHVTSRHSTSQHVTSRHSTSHHALTLHARPKTSHYMTTRHVTWDHITWHLFTLRHSSS